MELIKFIYEGSEVDFQPSGKDNVMVNATQMAKIFGKQVMHFNELESTKKFIESCLNYRDSRFIEEESGTPKSLIGVEKKEDLIISKQNSGTWMHRILALKFAAWLDSDFEVWVFTTIDAIINQYFRNQRDAMSEKLRIKQEKEAKKKELLLKNPELAEYFELEEQEREAHSKQIKAVRDQMKQLKLDFFAE